MHSPAASVILILQLSGHTISPLGRLEEDQGRRACVQVLPVGKACWSETEWREHLRTRTPRVGPWIARRSGERLDLLGPAVGVSVALPQPRLPAWQARVERWRLWVSETLRASDRGGILRALLLHEGSRDSAGGLLRLLGFVHLLNATGLHLLAAFAWNARAWLALGARLGWSVPASLWAARLCDLGWILGAWTLSGGRFGLLRSVMLIVLRRAARGTGFRWRFWAPLSLWAITETVVALSGRGEPGGWVYGLSVAGAIAVFWGRSRAPHWAMNIGSWAPVALWEGFHTGWVAWATPFLNWICLPLFATAIYPWSVACAALQWSAGLSAAGAVTAAVMERLSALALRFDGLWWVPAHALALGLGVSAAMLALRGWTRGARARWVLALIPAFALLGARFATHRADFGFSAPALMDVGQGDALLVASDRWNLLIDAGTDRARGDPRWLEGLASRGVFHLDALLLTHLDGDHAGGVARLARTVPIDCVGVPDSQWELPRTREWVARARQEWHLNVQRASRCSPLPQASLAPTVSRGLGRGRRRNPVPNDAMGAYLVPLSPSGVLVSFGDADRKQERALVKQMAAEIRSLGRPVVLKVSHHGSKTSSDLDMLRWLDPDEAWTREASRSDSSDLDGERKQAHRITHNAPPRLPRVTTARNATAHEKRSHALTLPARAFEVASSGELANR